MKEKATMTFPIVYILGLIFITLKLCGVIGWSWLWVLAPFWIPLVALMVLFAAAFIILLIVGIANRQKRRKS